MCASCYQKYTRERFDEKVYYDHEVAWNRVVILRLFRLVRLLQNFDRIQSFFYSEMNKQNHSVGEIGKVRRKLFVQLALLN